MEEQRISMLEKEVADLKRMLKDRQHVYTYGRAEEMNGYMVYASVIVDRVPQEFVRYDNGNFKNNLEEHLKKMGEFIAYDISSDIST